ncbi:MAG: UDP-N-acetylmuramoyl-tripeptide--D-alanyl-D-alanine ligase [Bacteroidetes bacterium]|nr:UDP-N-acetylmuramoyl-tripeptide--D-alanyl-D-alanine ligase [Bacteroidota bacterium]
MHSFTTANELYELFRKHPEIIIDTRKITPGCIFFALKGDTFDGNSFAHEALRLGASYAVIDNKSYHTENTLLVENALEALQQLAGIHRDRLKIPLIGITGTNGKTTTKELVNTVLGSHFEVQATKGNLNNHIGVPLTILSITGSTEIAIIEMGANHPGEIAFLCEIAKPTLGLITNIGKAHLEGFGGYDGVIKTKNELYQYIGKSSGRLFVNGNNELLMKLSDGIDRWLYGTKPEFQTSCSISVSDPFLELNWNSSGSTEIIHTQLVGGYNFENAVAAIAIGNYFKIPLEKITQSIEAYIPSNNRSQKVNTRKNNTVIMDAYNANPSSMNAALLNFSALSANNKMVILGDMLELGDESLAEHKAIVDLMMTMKFEQIVLVGPEFQKVAGNAALSFLKVEDAVDWLSQKPVCDYTILLKGSRGIRMEKIMDTL